MTSEIKSAERKSASDRMRTIEGLKTEPPARLHLRWSDGLEARIDFTHFLKGRGLKKLRDPKYFSRAKIAEWGHAVEWPDGTEFSAENLWLETLSAIGREDTRAFLEWRLRQGLSLGKTAEALGLSRRTIAYYSNGERPVPRAILLACKGWEAEQAA
jgi:hypothetical protein